MSLPIIVSQKSYSSVEYYRKKTQTNFLIKAKTNEINIEDVLNSNKYINWIESIDSEIDIKEILIQHIDYFGLKIGFIHLEVTAFYNGIKIPGIVLLRGDSVAVLVLLQIIDEQHSEMNNKIFIPIVKQPRIAISKSDFEEIPAGMMDEDNNLKIKVIDEVSEETGINIYSNEIIKIIDGYTSTGLLDEKISIFATYKSINLKEYNKINNRNAGNKLEGEQIIVNMVKLNYLEQIQDFKTMCAAFAWRKHYSPESEFKQNFDNIFNCNINPEDFK